MYETVSLNGVGGIIDLGNFGNSEICKTKCEGNYTKSLSP